MPQFMHIYCENILVILAHENNYQYLIVYLNEYK